MYDDGARSWAQDIEQLQQQLEAKSRALPEAEKRLSKLKSKKFVEQATAEVRALTADVESLTKQIEQETSRFFQTVFGILEGSVVALIDANSLEGQKVIASTLRVRTLRRGQVVVSVAGDLVDGDTGNRLSNTLLMAAEPEGKTLKALS